jgi:pSer/pThr/pTyr-binding forkhead associated (FHA) protein
MTNQIRLIERGANPNQTREIPINENEFLIGRAPDCNLRLRSEEVSRHHCTIRLSGGEATLVDLGSSNGSYLNGERVRSQARLKSGDEIRLGSLSFLIDLGDASASLGLLEVDPLVATMKLPKKPATETPPPQP